VLSVKVLEPVAGTLPSRVKTSVIYSIYMLVTVVPTNFRYWFRVENVKNLEKQNYTIHI